MNRGTPVIRRDAVALACPSGPQTNGFAAIPGLIGVLGGMGPLATVDFMQKMLLASPARCDQDHVPLLVSSIPQIPDRTAASLGRGKSPLPALLECASRLKAGGAAVIVIPCNTAHLWFDAVQSHVGIPMLHIVDEALAEKRRLCPGVARVGLLATEATSASGLYPGRQAADPAEAACEWLLPTAREMQEWVTPGIAEVKAGRCASGGQLLLQAARVLHRRGAAALILGCTEIPLVLDDTNSPVPVIDATTALARRAVAWSRDAGLLAPMPI